MPRPAKHEALSSLAPGYRLVELGEIVAVGDEAPGYLAVQGLEGVLELTRDVARELPDDPDVDEFVRLVVRADKLWAEK